jgi:ParB/RepB/Spo0J family partition protein
MSDASNATPSTTPDAMSNAATHPASPLQVVQVAIDELRPDPANPRRISPEELERLTRSIREFGFVQPILARYDDKIVISGHQRLVATRRLGLATVPVIFLDIINKEQAQVRDLALAMLLRRAATGSWSGR